MSPARTTASIAVARKMRIGAHDAGAASTRFTIRISMPPPGTFCRRTSSMKLRMRKMPRPLRLQEVLGRQGIGDFLGLEALALVLDPDDQFAGVVRRDGAELDDDALAEIALVAVLDGVDDRLADGDADPVELVLVEADHLADVIADDLHEIEHVESTAELEADRVAVASSGARIGTGRDRRGACAG